MGKQKKRLPKQKRKVPMAERSRKLTKKGKLKRRRGDLKMVHNLDVSFPVKQKKGGKWVRTGERRCNVHTVCNCVNRTDPTKMARVTNR
ncbi:phosphoprotein lepp12 [Trypanosoma brucei gambiense DAL972]|uniref:Phosphoprotein lepp12 n=2 Tax=Trypanosoma brucei TaxID=5691 RepID=Q57X84_TRYB2|nr:phosphoprotein lepp12 [Trypanosoma brucei gambiense DAL972]XP_846091.1 hypothetical protein, conserved [Trypanosoma brucei brucei TREU927]AAX69785.1 hypothetical protein, conserved [Trypanosoma brucei]AAZ12532.1 hypothetical protein, conserved [Trypanosoma brucei brucei TREU927]CBH12619.1 phosphoprotein lepp12 [Trypanosoma brucei gambiense DAL972]|eukprot:XP_011774899.1 phosphoprotein lepp12 [Trypanosoma brucei gambiense DAL972]